MTEQTETDQSATVSDETTEQLSHRGTVEPDEITEEEPETFPREYVVKLRDESAKHRQRAADRDDLAARLHAALVSATGRLADPTDLAFDDDHLTDPETLNAAIDDLLTRKPHLASRRIVGDVGQGVGGAGDDVNLAGLLRGLAS